MLDSNHLAKTRRITLTPTPHSLLTISMDTWLALDSQIPSPSDIFITLPRNFILRKHERNDRCKLCIEAAIQNFKWRFRLDGRQMPKSLWGYWEDRREWERNEREGQISSVTEIAVMMERLEAED